MPFSYDIEKLEPAFSDRPIPYIAYGAYYPSLALEHVKNTLNASRVFIVASATLSSKTPALKRLQDKLGDLVVGTHIGISSHTPFDQVINIANEARKAFGCDPNTNEPVPTDRDCVITLGAGSLTDGAKIISWVLANPQIKTLEDLDTMQINHKDYEATLPSLKPPQVRNIAIPTSLSGGEYQASAGATRVDGSNQKCSFKPPLRNPSLVILDPDLCTTTPEKIWLSTGIRAVDHCVETLCSLKSNEQGDKEATEGLLKLVPSLLRTKANHSDLDARFQSMMGVVEAMSAVSSGVPLGGSHAIGHQLGPLGVGHGETSCIMLPAVCKWNAKYEANVERQEVCKKVLLRTQEVQELVQKSGKNVNEIELGDILDLVIRALGMPRTLQTVGVGKDKLDGLAENTLHDRWAGTNAKPITEKGHVLEILEMVVE